jgi:TRAP transporter TAXI family solute receptor
MRDLLKVFLPITLLIVLSLAIAYQFVDPAPPKVVRMATGVEGGGYATFGKRYQEILARDGITLELVTTNGSMDNLRLLLADKGGVDVGFVQGGTAPAEAPSLVSLGSVFFEPLWVFVRADVPARRLADLRGRRLSIGVEGSGTRVLTAQLLAASGIADQTEMVSLGNQDAIQALLGRSVDAAFFVNTRPLPLLEPLLRSKTVRLMGIAQAEAFTKRFRYLSKIALPEGGLDLAADIPPETVTLLAPAAAVVARSSLHPAIIDQLLLAAAEVHGGVQLFGEPAQFPSPRYVDLPLSSDAERHFRRGPTFLRRTLPFWVAVWVERLVIMLLPLITLVIPLIRIGPPAYRWTVRRRIYRWYRDLRAIETRALGPMTPEERRELLARLEKVEGSVREIQVPLSFADSLYHLKGHIQFVRRLIGGVPGGSDDIAAAGPAPGTLGEGQRDR